MSAWTKTPPSKPGAYWWRSTIVKNDYPRLAFLDFVDGSWWMQRVGISGAEPLFEVSGEWCGPLVPVEEIEKAWNEGFLLGDLSKRPATDCWNESRAKQVVEGKL